MESISQLRIICQKSKTDDREKLGMSYKDWKSKLDLFFSIYFTRFFLLLGLSANTVTILSGICAVIGGILLASKAISIIIIGIVFFYLYTILDFSDGEVARYNKEGGINGWFLDWYMHFIRDAALFIGLSIGAYNAGQHIVILICGFITVLIPILDKSIIGCGWTVISWTQLGILNKGTKNITKKIIPHKKIKSIKSKIYKIPFTIFQHHWSLIILTLLIILQMTIDKLFSIEFDFRWFLIMYTGFLGPIYIIIKLHKIMANNVLPLKYQILFNNLRKPVSEDYF